MIIMMMMRMFNGVFEHFVFIKHKIEFISFYTTLSHITFEIYSCPKTLDAHFLIGSLCASSVVLRTWIEISSVIIHQKLADPRLMGHGSDDDNT